MNALNGKYQISDEEKARRAYAVRNSIATVQLEGLMIDDDAKAIYNEYVNGNLTSEEKSKKLNDGIAAIVAKARF